MKAYAGSFLDSDESSITLIYANHPPKFPPAGEHWEEVYEVEVTPSKGMELYDAGDSGLYHRGKTISGWYDGPLFDGPVPSHPQIKRI